MMGDRAPLADFVEVKRQHGFQCCGRGRFLRRARPNGRGLADETGLEDECDFIVGTFSKSVGAIGGFGAGNHSLFEALRYPPGLICLPLHLRPHRRQRRWRR